VHPPTHPGAKDIERAAASLAARLPWPLAPLAHIAYNYRWAWLPDGAAVFRDVDPRRWRMCHGNPVRLLQEASGEALLRAAADPGFVARIETVAERLREDLERPAAGPASPESPVAYFCAEYGIHASLPIYSGGLGALAGDVLKEASDRAVPLVAVGLMYRRGYFRQRIDATGWQQEFWVPTDPERTPAVLVTDDHGDPVTVTVPIGERDVHAHVWRVDVGRVPLYLLDSELPENDRLDRWITSRLYDGDPGTRLAQYALLGIGGMAALGALGVEPAIVHMNEGHAAFAALETARRGVAAGASLDEALEAARRRTVFTTHTPVPAGNDTYPGDQVAGCLGRFAEGLGGDVEAILRRGRMDPDDPGRPFGVTEFALRHSCVANGVSERHGGVSRAMWRGLWPQAGSDDEVPITHVTNGAHVPSWVGRPMRELLDRHLGEGWAGRLAAGDALEGVDAIPDEELWAVRCEQRRLLVEWVRDRSVVDRMARGDSPRYAAAAAHAFDPGALTVGFARRLATYKRLSLLLRDPHRSLQVLRNDERPIQILLAGKAHPRDDAGKALVQDLFRMREDDTVAARVVFLEDYDLGIAARLVRGCDVWVNVPRPPLEASGTSGMKSAVNGGLNLSVLDGWWAEAYDGANGWALDGDVDEDHDAQDHRHAQELYRLIEEEVLPEFHDRDEQGIPRAWLGRVKASLRTIIPAFSASRMVADYEERLYRRVAGGA
jgi:glycogen phosphorylase